MSALIKTKVKEKSLTPAVIDKPNLGMDVKEVGFLLRLIDEGSHQGKFLELALQVKLKLQGKMESLMETKEVI